MNKRFIHASDSSVQQNAEAYVLKFLAKKFELNFENGDSLHKKLGFKPDAIDTEKKVAIEVYARVGELKGGQKHKVNGDLLKLALLAKIMDDNWRLIMCFTSQEAAQHLLGKTWAAKAAHVFGIEVVVAELDSNLKFEITKAQKRQKR